MTTLIVATRNAHKVGEIRAILGEGFRVLCLKEFPAAPNAVEDADTFAGNSAKKALALAEWLHTTAPAELESHTSLVLADDSGLEVDALHGAPGVHSARFAALDSGAPENATDAENNAKLLRLLKDIPREKRCARFRCVLALADIAPASPARVPQFFEGACEGHIEFAPGGGGGFGYDPLFVPNGFTQSFAELGEDVKNRLSHRAKALEKLKAWFQVQG